MSDTPVIEISGARPAGLAAALAVSTAGQRALVYERRSDVGMRFHKLGLYTLIQGISATS